MTRYTRYQPVTCPLPSIKALDKSTLGHPLPTRYLPVTPPIPHAPLILWPAGHA